MKKNELVVLWESKKVFRGAIYWYKIVRYKGRTFKFVIEKRNGCTKRQCSIEVMTENGSYAFVADAYEINAPFDINDYCLIDTDRDNFNQLNNCVECFRQMENYITKVYNDETV